MPIYHEDQKQLSTRVGGTIIEAGYSGFLTDTTVAAADTIAGLNAAVSAAFVHADKEPMRPRILEAIRYGVADGSFTDALILPLTTIAGLAALTAANGSANVALIPD